MMDHKRGCRGREYTCTCGYDHQRLVAYDALVEAIENAIRHADENMAQHFGGRRSPETQASYDKCVAALKLARQP